MKINHSMCVHCVYVLYMYISCNFGQKIISGYGTWKMEMDSVELRLFHNHGYTK